MISPIVASFIGRGADRDILAVVLAQLRVGLSAALVLSGDAGIGKTQLLRQTLQDAADMQTIGMSGYESEVQLGFAALHRLVLPFLGDLSELPGPQRDALAVAFGLESGPPPNRFMVGLGTMTLLEHAACRGPLLCVVDDAQWVDQETLDTLAFVARRLDTEGVGLILSLRSNGPAPVGLSGIPEHRLPPMTDRDMRSLLSEAARTPPAAHVAARLIAESEGNPLALLEYVASLSPERLAGTAELPPALPVGERLSAGFAAQVSRLPAATQLMLLVLSAAGIDDADAVSEAGGRLGVGPNAWAPALRASILAARPRLMFRHPLIRSVVYDSAGTAARRRVHAVLAEVAGHHGFVDAVAWHRAHATSGPDEKVATQLERAAEHARARGGYAAEATFLTLATQRSAAGTDGHNRRLLAAARANIIAGHGALAEQLLNGSHVEGAVGARIEAERTYWCSDGGRRRQRGADRPLTHPAAGRLLDDVGVEHLGLERASQPGEREEVVLGSPHARRPRGQTQASRRGTPC